SQDQPHHGERLFSRQPGWLRASEPMGGALHERCPKVWLRGGMNYSYTQISQYLTCPRRYRHRYLDGWKEKDIRPAMLFGRAFERAVAAYFHRQDPAAVFFREWAVDQKDNLEFSKGDSWDRMLQQGIQLLERFAQDDRVR